MNVILNHRQPAIQISETEFKYLTGNELVDIIQSKNKEIADLNTKLLDLTKENQELKSSVVLVTPKQKKGKQNDVNNV